MIDFEGIRRRLPSLRQVLSDLGVSLTKQGSRWFARCPLPGHKDRRPSFSVYADGLRCGCPVCGWDGDVFDTYSTLGGLATQAEAAAALCERYGVDLIKQQSESRPARPARPAPPPPAADPTPPVEERKTARGKAIEHYDYTDEAGSTLYRVTRFEVVDAETREPIIKPTGKPDKTFLQARYDTVAGKWVSNMRGVRYVLYRLPQVLAADTIWLCEGERDVHALEAAGCVATTDAGGAGARAQFIKRGYGDSLREKTVIVVPDSDPVGRERGAMIANALLGVAAAVLTVDIEPYADVRDAIEAGVTPADLEAMARPFQPDVGADEPSMGDRPPDAEPERKAGRKPRTTTTVAAPGPQVPGGNPAWATHWPITKGAGNPAPVLANAIYALEMAPEWAGKLHFDEFSLRIVLRGGVPWSTSSADVEVKDHEEIAITNWLQLHGLMVGRSIVSEAMYLVAKKRTFHPVREYIDFVRQQWDGVERLPTWLEKYMGVDDDETGFASEAGLRWMIAAVARIYKPGCKADCALILEGGEGIRKSTALEVLGSPWFADDLPPMGGREAAIACAGVWIVEIAELQAMQKAGGWTTVLSFLSRNTDRYRPMWMKHTEQFPRQCIFAGTTNDRTYLEAQAGSRRFWSFYCSYISLESLRADRDQLWAEAAVRFHRGEQWWLSDQYREAAAKNQEMRVVADAWEDIIREWLSFPTKKYWKDEGTLTSISDSVVMREILRFCLGKREADITRGDEQRVAEILRRAGYIRVKQGTGAERHWRYVRTFLGSFPIGFP